MSIPRRFALIGHPVEHSLSPALHNAAAKALSLDWEYSLLDCADEMQLFTAIHAMDKGCYDAFNVTSPYKRFCSRLCEKCDSDALMAGGVNVLIKGPDGLEGLNCDGRGALAALRHASFDPVDKTILICGNGVSATAVAVSLAKAGAASICFAARNAGKAELLAEHLRCNLCAYPCRFDFLPLENVGATLNSFQLLINATTLGMDKDDPSPLPVEALLPEQYVMDLVYRFDTRLGAAARNRGCRFMDGRNMLLEQAIISFCLWYERFEGPCDDVCEARIRSAMEAAMKSVWEGED